MRGLALNRAEYLSYSQHEEILDSELLNVDSGLRSSLRQVPKAGKNLLEVDNTRQPKAPSVIKFTPVMRQN